MSSQPLQVGVEFMPGPNVGDGIYQLSLMGLMRSALPNASILPIDGPLTKVFPFRPPKVAATRLSSRGYELSPKLGCDCVCLSGPILGSDFETVYGPLVRAVLARGGNYIILSAHCPAPDAGLMRFLRDCPPLGIATRDRPSFENLDGLGAPTYDGVCASFLVSITCEMPAVADSGSYITVTCDKALEPSISFEVDASNEVIRDTVRVGAYTEPGGWKFRRHWAFTQSLPTRIGRHEVVRPVHDIGYKFAHLNYSRANSFLSYNPQSYLTLYAHTALTVSDRVHCCGPTLGYGAPAIFVGKTPRAAIFDRVGVVRNDAGVMTLCHDVIVREYDALRRWIAARF